MNHTKACFWFLNHSVIGKMHPTRPIINEYEERRKLRWCSHCGRETYNQLLCRQCVDSDEGLKRFEERAEIKHKFSSSVDEKVELLKLCARRGTCDVLAAHHELLESDPERLTTEFLVKMICNREYHAGTRTGVTLDNRLQSGRPSHMM